MDFAELGMKIDTADLDIAVQQLKKLAPAAAGASAATDKLSRAVEGLSTKTGMASIRAAQAVLQEAKASRAKLAATTDATKSDLAAASAAVKKAQADLAAARAAQSRSKATMAQIDLENQSTRATNAATVALRKQDAGLNGIAGRLANGKPANDQMPNRFNTANIAAQFQDIGVTAAAGMSPLTIALQQGTQLSAILNSMENPLKGIGAAFTQVINPVSLMTIGIIGLVAAGLQMVNWTSVAKSGLIALADVIESIGPYFLAAGAAVTLVYTPSIIAATYAMARLGVVSLIAGGQMAAAWLLANPLALVALLAAATAAASVWLVGNVKAFREFANFVLGIFVGLGRAIIAFFSPDNLLAAIGNGIISLVNFVLEKVKWVINQILTLEDDMLKQVSMGALSISYRVPEQNFPNPFGDSAEKAGKEVGDAFLSGFDGTDYVGKIGDTVGSGLKGASDRLKKLAAGLGADAAGAGKGGKSEADRYAEIIKNANIRIKQLSDEQNMLSMTAQQAAIYQEQQNLINDALKQGIVLTPAQTAQLKSLGAEMAGISEQTRRTKEALDFLRDTGKGFFQDMKSGLQEGKGLWASFADAVANALNRMLDQMFNSGLDQLFGSITSGSGAGGSIVSSIADWLFNADGNAFGQSGVQPFAKGGSFTNSIVSSPTMFAFAGGGQFGVMGEAGPEAVMPLQRGSDGSLGVRVVGGGSGSVVVNVINNSNSQSRTEQRTTSQGTEIDVIIDEMVAKKLESKGSASDRALNSRDSRQLIRR